MRFLKPVNQFSCGNFVHSFHIRAPAMREYPVAADAAGDGHPGGQRAAVTFPDTAWKIGRDMGRHGFPIVGEQFRQSPAIYEGWLTGRDQVRGNSVPADALAHQWLCLRLAALQRREPFDASLTLEALKAVIPRFCPILRTPLHCERMGAEAGQKCSWTIARLVISAGHVASNCFVLSEKAGLALAQAHDRAQEATRPPDPSAASGVFEQLTQAQRARLAFLMTMASTPGQVAEHLLPMRLFPPLGLSSVNQVVRFQEYLSARYWGQLQGIGISPAASALSPRALQATQDLEEVLSRAITGRARSTERLEARWITEDAWATESVQEVWAAFAAALTPKDSEGLKNLHDLTAAQVVHWRRQAGIDRPGPGHFTRKRKP